METPLGSNEWQVPLFLQGGGALGARIRATNWTTSSMGSPHAWPQSLRTLLALLMTSSHPMFLVWGASRTRFTNDAFTLAGVPPPADGDCSLVDDWVNDRHDDEMLVERAFAGESALWAENHVATARLGQPEQARSACSYTAIRQGNGDVEGVLGICVESVSRDSHREGSSTDVPGPSSKEDDQQREVLDRNALLKRIAGLSSANSGLDATARFIRKVTDMVPGRMSYWTRDLRCMFANKAFAVSMGTTVDGVIGRSAESVFGAERINLVRAHIDAALAGMPQQFERQVQKPDGTIEFTQVNYVPDNTSDGGIYFLAVDVTELKNAQASLSIANENLAQSRDEALSASRAKSAFLANMSHEIRTPLTAILGMTYILSRSVKDAVPLNQLGKIDRAAKHLLGLITDILDFSKIEAGKLVLEKHEFVMRDIVERTIEMVRDPAQLKGLTVESDVAGLAMSYRGDSLRLSQVLLNFLSNAVKFTSAGSVRLRCHMVEKVGERHLIRFEVHDTGIGIALDHHALLFNSFTQADNSIARRHGGTGLGLALSRELARSMGGEVGVQSQLGFGSTFWFTAWLDEVAAADAGVGRELRRTSPLTDQAELESRVRLLHGGQRVLLAEDNVINREVGIALLEGAGLHVSVAEDGEVAISMAKSERFDLILTDMQMPNVDGLVATRAIRKEMLSMPIIAMTANAFLEDRQACLEAGMDDHVAKPVEPTVLYLLLLQWLPALEPSSV